MKILNSFIIVEVYFWFGLIFFYVPRNYTLANRLYMDFRFLYSGLHELLINLTVN